MLLYLLQKACSSRSSRARRAVETKLLKLVLFIVGGIGTISCRVWMHKVRVWRAHREVTGTIPLNRRGMFPVRFDLIVTSVKELTVEANKLEKRNPIQADGIEG